MGFQSDVVTGEIRSVNHIPYLARYTVNVEVYTYVSSLHQEVLVSSLHLSLRNFLVWLVLKIATPLLVDKLLPLETSLRPPSMPFPRHHTKSTPIILQRPTQPVVYKNKK